MNSNTFNSDELEIVMVNDNPILTPKNEQITDLLREGKLGMLWFIYQSNMEDYIRTIGYNTVDEVNERTKELYNRHQEGIEIYYENRNGNIPEEEQEDPEDYYVKESELDPVLEQFRGVLHSIQEINRERTKYPCLLRTHRPWEEAEVIEDCFIKPITIWTEEFVTSDSSYNRDLIPEFYQLSEVNADTEFITKPEEVVKNTSNILCLLSNIYKLKGEEFYKYVAKEKILLNRNWNVQIYGQSSNDNTLVIEYLAFLPWNQGKLIFDLSKGEVPGWTLVPTKGKLDFMANEDSSLARIAYRKDSCDFNYRLAEPWDLFHLVDRKECFVGDENAIKYFKRKNSEYPGLYY